MEAKDLELNKEQLAMACYRALRPRIKHQIAKKHKGWWNWTFNTRIRFVHSAIEEIMADPKFFRWKNLIAHTPYRPTNGFLDMPYYQLAVKLQDAV